MAQSAAITKQQQREAKARHRAQKHAAPLPRRVSLDVGCVIHGDVYDWCYVDRLYSMVSRNLSIPVTLHVWTEHDRSVPPQYVKHCLEEWPGIRGPKKSWWYKMQMFNSNHFAGDLLYFDLDVIICGDISWVMDLPTSRFWALRDFRHLQRPTSRVNSSMMWWNTTQFQWVWERFQTVGAGAAAQRWHGDQDFIQNEITGENLHLIPDGHAQSWRWSAWQGGMDWGTRRYRAPGTGTEIGAGVSVLVFHGHPKPHEIRDPVIAQLWC